MGNEQGRLYFKRVITEEVLFRLAKGYQNNCNYNLTNYFGKQLFYIILSFGYWKR